MHAVVGLDPALGLPIGEADERSTVRLSNHATSQQNDIRCWNKDFLGLSEGIGRDQPCRLDGIVDPYQVKVDGCPSWQYNVTHQDRLDAPQ